MILCRVVAEPPLQAIAESDAKTDNVHSVVRQSSSTDVVKRLSRKSSGTANGMPTTLLDFLAANLVFQISSFSSRRYLTRVSCISVTRVL